MSKKARIEPNSYSPIRFYLDVNADLRILEGQLIVGIERGFIIGAVVGPLLRPVYDAADTMIL